MSLNTMRRPLLAALSVGALSFAAVAGTADRVRADFKDYADRALVHYALPAMSESQRLPDAYPEDGQAGATVRIRAAKGEYEPGAFGVWATRDLGKVEFEIGDLKQVKVKGEGEECETGVLFPKDNLDLALVKCWYQNLNGWFSYFSDNGFKLVPELLLHNEELIRCDDAKKANYARIVGADGKTTERWLNPPQKMDRLVSPNVPWRTREPFQPMRPGFHDADKLQPVLLPKEEFRCFFLTAHVTKDIPAGLYKGVIQLKNSNNSKTQTLGSVPVEIEVLDFELPAPKSYHEPQTDFLVSFYSYDELGNIREYNGGDRELARRQLKTILENQVAHGQSVHMMGGNLSGEVLDTVKKMVEAGMRPDVIQGGASPSTRHGLTHAQTAEIIRAECDRRFGHHNVYMTYGDEPGFKWLLRERPVLHTYIAAGLKFYIAGSDSVYHKDGHLFDWHNIAQDPAKGFSAPLWNAVGENHVAWYAQQHVGAENPALNRRQNGMGAYLSGYTALCNYAHHLGEYDDDRDMYRPMVFAYGTDNGVIDTIQWEGFREGIDDIRYATLLTQLARSARKSSVPSARQLGAKALQYLAMFDRGAGDLDTCRAEMTRYIQGLLAYEKPDPVRPVARPQPKPADADRLFAEETAPLYAKLAAAKTVAATNACVRELQVACRRHFRYEELLAISEKYDEPYGVIEAAEQLFDDAKADAWRMQAYRTGRLPSQHAIVPFLGELMSRHPNIENEPAFAAALYRGRDTNALVRAVWNNLGKQSGWMRDAFFPVWKRFYAINAAMADRVGEKGMSAEAAKLGVEACVATGDWALLQTVVARARANEKLKSSDRYTLELAAAVLKQDVLRQGAPDVAALLKAVDVTDVVPEDRAKAIQQVGAWAMLANSESLVRGLEACRKGLYRPAPKKQYRVRHSSVPVEGPTSWGRLDIVPETAVYDRQFGGSTEAFATDVTTGTRSTGSAKETLKPTRMQIVTDDWGLHFRFESPDPKAREVESERVSGGSFEMYLSPGKNKPYMTMSITPGRDVMSVFNTQYETFGHRRLLGERPETYRLTTTFGASNIVVGLSIPWEAYAADVPVMGAVWDFENLYWHRAGNCAWNGTDTIHGRSTWGELVFEMPEAARVRIQRRLGRKACLSFLREVNRVGGYEGCVVHWEDDEVGDPAFYLSCLKDYVSGLVEKTKAFRKDPSDDLVRAYDEDGTFDRWRDIFFEVSRRRAQWLNRGEREEPYAVSWERNPLALEDARISSVPFCRVWPGHQREISQTEMSHFVRFDWTVRGTLSVKGKGVGKALKQFLPMSARGIVQAAGDDVLTLAISRPGAYVLEFEGLPTLHVFADPPLKSVPVPGPGGRLIRFEKGEHHPGVVAPKSGDVVVLDEGAVVYGSLFILNATNVTVTGRGIFDGSKLERADKTMKAFRRQRGLPEIDTESACFAYSVYGSENVTISGVTFRDPPFWTLVVRNQCRKTLIDNIHIVGNWRYNSDGIDVCASAETEIRNSFIRTFDDCVIARGPYMKGEFAPVSGMTVTNCDLWADWGVIFKAQVQDFHGSTIEDVRMKNCRFLNLQDTGIFLAVRYGCDLDIIRRLTFEDLEYDFRPQARPKIQKKDGEAFVAEPFIQNYLLYAGSYTLGKNLDNQRNAPMEDPNYYHFIFEDIACRRFKAYGEKRNLIVHMKADVPRHEIRRVTREDLPPHRLSR